MTRATRLAAQAVKFDKKRNYVQVGVGARRELVAAAHAGFGGGSVNGGWQRDRLSVQSRLPADHTSFDLLLMASSLHCPRTLALRLPSLSHSLSLSLSLSLFHPPTHPFAQSLTHSYTYVRTHPLSERIIDSLTHSHSLSGPRPVHGVHYTLFGGPEAGSGAYHRQSGARHQGESSAVHGARGGIKAVCRPEGRGAHVAESRSERCRAAGRCCGFVFVANFGPCRGGACLDP